MSIPPIEQRPIADLTLWPGNARRGNVKSIKESMAVNDVFQPILVQSSTGKIIAGNHRFKALRELNSEDPDRWPDEVPVIPFEVTDEQAARMHVADNKTSDDADWDNELLLAQLDELAGSEGGLPGTGFDDDELEDLRDAVAGEGAPGSMDLVEPPDDDNYVEQYAVTVICQDEEHQEKVYEDLQGQGYTAKVVTV